MRGRINLILAAILVLGTLPQTAFGFVNPLKSYNLYEDTHPKGSNRDNVMSQEFYHVNDNNSNTNTNANPAPAQSAPPKIAPTTADGDVNNAAPAAPQRRNDYLRQSSKKVYGSGSGNWSQGPYFYPNPTMKSIRWKYHISNFAGCMQECEAYVQKYPSDTLGYYYLAMSYAKCGDKDNAIRAYERVISLNANPMIVKYATNGRNCVMGKEDEAKCFQNVNEPEYLYPYRDIAKNMDMTPVDPQKLIDRNITQLQNKLNPPQTQNKNQNNNNNNGNNDGNANANNNRPKMPFENQDEQLDKFIRAPYGSGLSQKKKKQYKQTQLKNLQEQINSDENDAPGRYFQNIRNLKRFDKEKSDASDFVPVKLALAQDLDVDSLLKNPEYVKNKKELDELKMMLGTSDSTSDITTMLPEIAKDGGNISPQVIQAMMMQAVMPNIIDVDSKNGF